MSNVDLAIRRLERLHAIAARLRQRQAHGHEHRRSKFADLADLDPAVRAAVEAMRAAAARGARR